MLPSFLFVVTRPLLTHSSHTAYTIACVTKRLFHIVLAFASPFQIPAFNDEYLYSLFDRLPNRYDGNETRRFLKKHPTVFPPNAYYIENINTRNIRWLNGPILPCSLFRSSLGNEITS
ncbi:hypothetical protein EI94DRAFT_888116 [Lactarius quietus]|nr:hypothetical protein EI94DRAFT_888116 [Lactarius quietus]